MAMALVTTRTDDDGDGLSDSVESEGGSNPLVADTDGDGVIDGQDAFPTEVGEVLDTDGDGIGNNADTDDDGDQIADSVDIEPLTLQCLHPAFGVRVIGENVNGTKSDSLSKLDCEIR